MNHETTQQAGVDYLQTPEELYWGQPSKLESEPETMESISLNSSLDEVKYSSEKTLEGITTTMGTMTMSASECEDDRNLSDGSRGERNSVRELEDLTNWAPADPSQVTENASVQSFSHLPDWSTLERPFQVVNEVLIPGINFDDNSPSSSDRGPGASSPTAWVKPDRETSCDSLFDPNTEQLTAYPQETTIRKDLEDRLLRLLDLAQFELFLSNPEAREIFRNWLIERSDLENPDEGSKAILSKVMKLDQWTNMSLASALAGKAALNSKPMKDTSPQSSHAALSSVRPRTISRISSKNVQLASSQRECGPSRNSLLRSLYDEDFRSFIASKLVEMCKLKLGNGISDNDYSGLGDSFVLTNPRFNDNPIVIISPGFAAVTGYESDMIIGRNCRFLQGPGTCPKSIDRMRKALRAGEPCVELLLNYRSDGTPFQCLLSMLPLFDQTGALTYFIGGQVNITGDFEACRDLASFVISRSGSSPSSIKGYSTELSRNSTREPDLQLVNKRQSPRHGSVASNFTPPSSDQSRMNMSTSFTEKSPTFKWITSRVRRHKETINLAFDRSNTRFVSDPGSSSTFESNIRMFQSTYSRFILLKKSSRAILFVTFDALKFLGLPTETYSDVYASPLIHTDFLDLIEASKGNHTTKELKTSLKGVLQSDKAASVKCQLTWSYIPYLDERGTLNKRKKITVAHDCFVHLSPLIDCSATCTSYMAVLS